MTVTTFTVPARPSDQPVALLLLTAEVAGHLALALANHDQVCRRGGTVMPAALSALVEVLTARSGQERTKLGDLAAPVEPLAVDLKTAALRISLSERTVRRMAADGRLRTVPAGRRRLVPVAELKRFMEEGAA